MFLFIKKKETHLKIMEERENNWLIKFNNNKIDLDKFYYNVFDSS